MATELMFGLPGSVMDPSQLLRQQRAGHADCTLQSNVLPGKRVQTGQVLCFEHAVSLCVATSRRGLLLHASS